MLSSKIPAAPWKSWWLEGHHEVSWLCLELVGQLVKSIFCTQAEGGFGQQLSEVAQSH